MVADGGRMKAQPAPAVVAQKCVLCNGRCKRPSHWPKHVARSCLRKRAYTSLTDAIDMAMVTRQVSEHTHVYLCPLKDHWHVSSKRFLIRPQSELTPISEILDDMGFTS